MSSWEQESQFSMATVTERLTVSTLSEEFPRAVFDVGTLRASIGQEEPIQRGQDRIVMGGHFTEPGRARIVFAGQQRGNPESGKRLCGADTDMVSCEIVVDEAHLTDVVAHIRSLRP